MRVIRSSGKNYPSHPWCTNRWRKCAAGFRRDSSSDGGADVMVGALAAFYHDVLDVENPEHRALARHPLAFQNAHPRGDEL